MKIAQLRQLTNYVLIITYGILSIFPNPVMAAPLPLSNMPANLLLGDLVYTISTSEISPTSTTPFEVLIYFNPKVNDFTINDVVVTNGTASDLVTVSSNIFEITFSVLITPLSDGDVIIKPARRSYLEFVKKSSR